MDGRVIESTLLMSIYDSEMWSLASHIPANFITTFRPHYHRAYNEEKGSGHTPCKSSESSDDFYRQSPS